MLNKVFYRRTGLHSKTIPRINIFRVTEQQMVCPVIIGPLSMTDLTGNLMLVFFMGRMLQTWHQKLLPITLNFYKELFSLGTEMRQSREG
ncbi:MAG: hypothetical protein D3921_04400 [Candidatus Electrothrix sp. AW1]|nr:hypothetical protein [Candidatus Electrothrix gigas]